MPKNLLQCHYTNNNQTGAFQDLPFLEKYTLTIYIYCVIVNFNSKKLQNGIMVIKR